MRSNILTPSRKYLSVPCWGMVTPSLYFFWLWFMQRFYVADLSILSPKNDYVSCLFNSPKDVSDYEKIRLSKAQKPVDTIMEIRFDFNQR